MLRSWPWTISCFFFLCWRLVSLDRTPLWSPCIELACQVVCQIDLGQTRLSMPPCEHEQATKALHVHHMPYCICMETSSVSWSVKPHSFFPNPRSGEWVLADGWSSRGVLILQPEKDPHQVRCWSKKDKVEGWVSCPEMHRLWQGCGDVTVDVHTSVAVNFQSVANHYPEIKGHFELSKPT